MTGRLRFLSISSLVAMASGCVMADIGEGEEEPGLEEIEFAADNGIFLDNGLNLANGLNLGNGTTLRNGLNLGNGIDVSNGLNLGNGISGPYYAPPSGSGLEQWIDVDPAMRKKVLRYLIECALPAGVRVQLRYRGQLETLAYGVAGLGASLQKGRMGEIHQERVTACMLARMNGAGRTVQIDLFGEMGDAPGFDTTVPADDAFPVLEAAFFGNIFSPDPYAAACQRYPYALADMRSCKDLGGGQYDCGIIEFAADLCAVEGDLGGYAHCDSFYTGGSDQRVYFANCGGGELSWQYVITSYIAPKPSGQPCFSHDECASGECSWEALACR